MDRLCLDEAHLLHHIEDDEKKHGNLEAKEGKIGSRGVSGNVYRLESGHQDGGLQHSRDAPFVEARVYVVASGAWVHSLAASVLSLLLLLLLLLLMMMMMMMMLMMMLIMFLVG